MVTYCFLGKSKVINIAIQDMGMGRYQWELFGLCGFGWLAGQSNLRYWSFNAKLII